MSHSKLEYQRGIGLLDRDNVAIVVMLQPRGLSSSHQLCVANTHLLWNPRRGDIKLAQLGKQTRSSAYHGNQVYIMHKVTVRRVSYIG